MKRRSRFLVALVAAAVVLAVVPMAAGAAEAGTPDVITVPLFGTTSVGGGGGDTGDGTLGPVATEIQRPKRLGSSPLRGGAAQGDAVALPPGEGPPVPGAPRPRTTPHLALSFEGLNHRDSRLAFGGNQFSGEPADQGLCVGNGYLLETVNSALRV
jgi:hypothetical protein